MPIQATITLERLVCFEESDQQNTSHSEPYVWPWLGILDGGQFSSTPTVATEFEARRNIKDEMRANESAQLPLDGNNRLVAQFDTPIRHLFLVVALLEADFDIPADAIRAGYQAYLDELNAQFRLKIGPLVTADTDEDRQAIVDVMKKAVRDKATEAIKDALGVGDTILGILGALDRDDFIAADFWHFDTIAPTVFTLGFRGVSGDPKVRTNFMRPLGISIQEFPVNYFLDCRLDAPDPNATHGPLDGGTFQPVVG
ncbi:MAG: hypothetical protein J7493_01485 [Porphyrobacter sp.]|nr:hypothetical protein [Porphyrobacter sp.]